MNRLGIIANVQPSFVPTDMRWVQDRLDPRHMPYAYAWKTLLKNGVHVAGGSDAPIEKCSPFLGIYDAISRLGRNDLAESCFKPEERLTFSEALWIYTMEASYASMTEHVIGAIKPGYAADLLFVDPSIVADHSRLPTYEPARVMVGGQIVYDKSSRGDGSASGAFTKLEGDHVPGKNGNLSIKFAGRFPFTCKCCSPINSEITKDI